MHMLLNMYILKRYFICILFINSLIIHLIIGLKSSQPSLDSHKNKDIDNGDDISNIKVEMELTNSRPTEEQMSIKRNIDGCIEIDGFCISESEILNYQAIKSLHAQLDDDRSGDIDLTESNGFLREELNYTRGLEKRQKAFHYNNDQHISVQELWTIWFTSEVHNWTVEQTVSWLDASVELGQYSTSFYENAINGSMLPRLAANTDQFLTRAIQIKNSKHRSKISIKAMDIVLFGPPKEMGSLMKDIFIFSLIAFILVLLYKFFKMRQHNDRALKKMDQEMEVLQEELMKFHEVKKNEETAKSHMDDDFESINFDDSVSNYHDEDRWEVGSSHGDFDLDQVTKNKLQLWLQLSYEREKIAFTDKIEYTKKQLDEAKEKCDKLKPSKKNFFGALSFIHGNIETKGHPIIEAQNAVQEIRLTNEELKFRWNSIESLLGFDITRNHGLHKLELVLEPNLQSFLHTPNVAVGMTEGSEAGGRSSPTHSTAKSLQNFIAEDQRIYRRKPIQSNGSVDDCISSTGSSFLRNNPALPLRQSHTVGTGLSNYGAPLSELRVKKVSKFNGALTPDSPTKSFHSSIECTSSPHLNNVESKKTEGATDGEKVVGVKEETQSVLNSSLSSANSKNAQSFSSQSSVEISSLKKGKSRNSFFSKFRLKGEKVAKKTLATPK